MITSNDVRNKKFEKAAFGYKQEEMDEFLAQLETELDEMEQERNDANNKISVLAEKVREYMRDEDALKDALLMAQKQGHQVIDEANEKAEKILDEARIKAAALEDEAVRQHAEAMKKNADEIAAEKQKLADIKAEVAAFKRELLDMYSDHLRLIATIPELPADEPEDTAEEAAPAETAAEAAADTAAEIIAEAAAENDGETNEGGRTAADFLAAANASINEEAAENAVNTLTETPADAVAAFAAEESVD
ncbi:MAG: DivIVA domain-containing protein [Ruminococcus sp.]|nr:DivIVA domain-containing protein [Ruminococcus sp.]